jgi:hypothetical protein
LSNELSGRTAGSIDGRFGVGIEDAIILPLVLIATAAKHLFKAALSLLIHILDFAFPILLQLARFPLFTIRIVGDGVAALLRGIVGCLPVSGARREAWREVVSARWSWLRQRMSYKAFEQAVHRAFERGMAWVFRTCRALTPRGALLVMTGAVLWLPASFGVATALHVALIAKAASLPPWMQLLHLLATIIAKSKLLILPVYPAAWPQAKKHAFVQATFRVYRYVASLHLMQKTGYRYQQTELAMLEAADALGRAAACVGAGYPFNSAIAALERSAAWIGSRLRAAMVRAIEGASQVPLIGSIVAGYAAHYADVNHLHTERFSEKLRGFFARWSIKFSAEYYEAKEQEEAAERHVRAQAAPASTRVTG